MSGQRPRPASVSIAAATIGLVLVLTGIPVEGYGEAVLLQFGSVLILLAPVYYFERLLDRRVVQVEDSVAGVVGAIEDEAVTPAASVVESRVAWEANLLTALREAALHWEPPLEVIGRHPVDGNAADGRIDGRGVFVILELKYRQHGEIESAVLIDAVTRSRRRGGSTLLVTNRPLTRSAMDTYRRLVADRSTQFRHVKWDGSSSDDRALISAVEHFIPR